MWALVTGFLKSKLILLILVAAMSASGWLLIKAHEQIGAAEAETEQWQIANQHWSDFWQAKQLELARAEKRLLDRDKNYKQIQGQLDDYRQRLQALNNDADRDDINCRVSRDQWLLIKESAAQFTAGKLPGGQPDSTDPDRDP